MRCNRPDCGRGEIDEQNFCTECNRRPLPTALDVTPPATPPREKPAAKQPQTATSTLPALGVERVRPEPWWGLELARSGQVPEPRVETPDAVEALDEEQRFCSNCGRAVGRPRNGRPGRVRGFCPGCTTQFDFSQTSSRHVFGGRYELLRKIGEGGQGTTYLVLDRNLGANVVLKVLRSSVVLDTAERDALVGLRHDSIVRIFNYEPEGPYLVLELVPGVELAADTADPLDVTLAHGLQILQALDYLHARKLLHCDVKPSNIVRFEDVTAHRRDRVRLIDFGAVRAFNDTRPVMVYSSRYAPPVRSPKTDQTDPEHVRPSAAFDLFCLGNTLRELSDPHVNGSPSAPGVESLRLLIARATEVDMPKRRFTSARQFAEQLSGVIRQIVADPELPQPRQVTRPSALFGEVTGALHGGLGAPRPLQHWVKAEVFADDSLELQPPFANPSKLEVLNALPIPLTDPDEDEPTRAALEARAACRSALRSGLPDAAKTALDSADLPDWHWLRHWYAGSIALLRTDVPGAMTEYMAVRRLLPGELVPMLALGLCAELNWDLETGALGSARQYYTALANTAPALGAAGFGLARVHLHAGRRAEAVQAAEQLAAASEYRLAPGPQIAAIRLLVALPDTNTCAPPTESDLVRARELLDALAVDEETRTALEAEIEYARSVVLGNGAELSETMRRVAVAAKTKTEFVALIDLANRLRPPVRWPAPWLLRPRRVQRRSPGVSAN